MINFESILSVFDEKGTLLKWLQRVEQALNGDTLQGVEIVTLSETQIKLQFNFKDGTNLLSDPLTLARGVEGPTGPAGRGITAVAAGTPTIDPAKPDYTLTPVTVQYTDGNSTNFKVYAKDGAEGKEGPTGPAGRGIIAVASGQPTEDPNVPFYTITPVTAQFSDGSGNTFKVYAKDGTDGTDGKEIIAFETQPPMQVDGYTQTDIIVRYNDNTSYGFVIRAKNGEDGSKYAYYMKTTPSEYYTYLGDNIQIQISKLNISSTEFKVGSLLVAGDGYIFYIGGKVQSVEGLYNAVCVATPPEPIYFHYLTLIYETDDPFFNIELTNPIVDNKSDPINKNNISNRVLVDNIFSAWGDAETNADGTWNINAVRLNQDDLYIYPGKGDFVSVTYDNASLTIKDNVYKFR